MFWARARYFQCMPNQGSCVCQDPRRYFKYMPGSGYSREDAPWLNAGKRSYNREIRIEVYHIYGITHEESMNACTRCKQEAVAWVQATGGDEAGQPQPESVGVFQAINQHFVCINVSDRLGL